MSTLAVKLDATATDVRVTDATLHIVLADGRELTAPLAWFPRLLEATPEQRRHWRFIGRARAFIGRTSIRIFRSPACSAPCEAGAPSTSRAI